MKPLFQSEAKCEAIDMKMIFYKVFSHEVTAAILVSQNNEMAAMLVSQTSPLGVELFSYANAFFCYHICIFAGHVSENTLFSHTETQERF